MDFTDLETERLILRKLNLEDAQDMFELDSNPNVVKYIGIPPVEHIDQSREILKNVLKQYEENGVGRLAMIEKSTGMFIGWAGLKYEKEIQKDAPYYDIGYRLKEQYWGNGFGKEASVASLAYAFDRLKLNQIDGLAHIDNIASNKILEGIGLKHKRRYNFENMEFNWYGLTKDEWDRKKT